MLSICRFILWLLSLVAVDSAVAQDDAPWIERLLTRRPSPLAPAVATEALGRFSDTDPDRLARVWRRGAEPGRCVQLQMYAIARARAHAEIQAEFDAEHAKGEMSGRDQLLVTEGALLDTMVHEGREADAEAWLRRRLALTPRRIEHGDSEPVTKDRERRLVWRTRLAHLVATTRPAEAKSLVNAVTAEREQEIRSQVIAPDAHLPRNHPTRVNTERRADLLALQMRFDLTKPLLDAENRVDQALGIASDLAAAYDAGSTRTLPGRLRVDLAILQARQAVAQGRHAEAEAVLRRCCMLDARASAQIFSKGDGDLGVRALGQLSRLLLSQRRVEEARPVILNWALAQGSELDSEVPCLGARQNERLPSVLEARSQAEREIASRGQRALGSDAFGIVQRMWKLLPHLERSVELGAALLDAGLPHDARAVLQPTMAISELVFSADHPLTLRAMASLSRAERSRGQIGRAIELGLRWRAGSEAFLAGRLWNVSEAVRRRFFAEDRVEVGHWIDTQLAAPSTDTPLEVLALSLGRKGLLSRVASDVMSRARADQTLQPRLEQLRRRRGALAALALRDASETPDGLRIRRELEALEGDLGAAVRRGQPSAAPTAVQVLSSLGPDEALVDVLVFDDPADSRRERVVAVVARAGRPPQIVRWDEAAALRGALLRLRQVAQQGGAQEIESAAAELSALWWQPLEPHVGDARRVSFVPDGLLHLLPLSLLRSSDGRRVVDALPGAWAWQRRPRGGRARLRARRRSATDFTQRIRTAIRAAALGRYRNHVRWQRCCNGRQVESACSLGLRRPRLRSNKHVDRRGCT